MAPPAGEVRLPGIVRWQDHDQIAVITFRDTKRLATTLDLRA